MVSLRPLQNQTEMNEEALEDANKKDDGEHEKQEEDPTSADNTVKVVHR